MVTINLLPWRPKKQVFLRQFLLKKTLLVSVFWICFAVIFHVIFIEKIGGLSVKITQQNAAIEQFFSDHETVLSDNHDEQSAIKKVVKQAKTGLMYFSAWAQFHDENTCLMRVEQDAQTVMLAGRTRSAADLTALLDRWDVGEVIAEIKLESLVAAASGLEFVLRGVPRG